MEDLKAKLYYLPKDILIEIMIKNSPEYLSDSELLKEIEKHRTEYFKRLENKVRHILLNIKNIRYPEEYRKIIESAKEFGYQSETHSRPEHIIFSADLKIKDNTGKYTIEKCFFSFYMKYVNAFIKDADDQVIVSHYHDDIFYPSGADPVYVSIIKDILDSNVVYEIKKLFITIPRFL